MRHLALVVVVVAGLLAGCNLFDNSREQAWWEVRQATLQQLRAEQGRNPRSPLVGVSAAADLKVPPLNEKRIGADLASPEFHTFYHRCAACHHPPAPESHSVKEWPGLVDQMSANIRKAGLLPLSGEDRDAILRFLGRHARDADH